MGRREHWELVYAGKPSDRLGWYRPHLQTSLAWIEELGLARDAPIIDVGGGASTLVDDLLHLGYRAITILDISDKALTAVKSRLGENAGLVTWITGDVTTIDLADHYYELWHDRAVFHFLTDADEQGKYRERLLKALRPGGLVIMATFAAEAPPKCSGLPVQRYSLERLQDTLGDAFELIKHHKEMHVTPGGVEQMYLYCQFRRAAASDIEIT